MNDTLSVKKRTLIIVVVAIAYPPLFLKEILGVHNAKNSPAKAKSQPKKTNVEADTLSCNSSTSKNFHSLLMLTVLLLLLLQAMAAAVEVQVLAT
jgi:hypothetical protein